MGMGRAVRGAGSSWANAASPNSSPLAPSDLPTAVPVLVQTGRKVRSLATSLSLPHPGGCARSLCARASRCQPCEGCAKGLGAQRCWHSPRRAPPAHQHPETNPWPSPGEHAAVLPAPAPSARHGSSSSCRRLVPVGAGGGGRRVPSHRTWQRCSREDRPRAEAPASRLGGACGPGLCAASSPVAAAGCLHCAGG